MNRLEGSVAIVTGGARGIGEGIVRRFVAEGAKVMITDVLADQGQALADELGDAAAFHAHDVTDRAQWAAVVAATEARFGKLTTLVNNAGIIVFKRVDDLTDAEIDRLLDINLKGVIVGTQAVIPAIERAGGGAIVNMSSADGIAGANSLSVYCASKFAVRGFTKACALELGPRKIRVNSINPGLVQTEGTTSAGIASSESEFQKQMEAQTPLGRIGQTQDIAPAALFLASSDSAWITGESLYISGGLR